MKEERSGPYLLPPLQLTKDPLKALVHVVKLEKNKNRIAKSAFWYATVGRQRHRDTVLLFTAGEGKCVDYLTNYNKITTWVTQKRQIQTQQAASGPSSYWSIK